MENGNRRLGGGGSGRGLVVELLDPAAHRVVGGGRGRLEEGDDEVVRELGHAEGAGLVLGAKVPVILNSRSDSPMSRLASCAVAAIHHFANQTTTPSRP